MELSIIHNVHLFKANYRAPISIDGDFIEA